MIELKIAGIIRQIKEINQITDSFQKREFVIEIPSDNPDYDGEFPQFQLVQAKCDLLDKYKVGDEVEVYFNIKGRKYQDKVTNETKVFTTLQAWRLSSVKPEQQGPPESEQFTPREPQQQQTQAPSPTMEQAQHQQRNAPPQ